MNEVLKANNDLAKENITIEELEQKCTMLKLFASVFAFVLCLAKMEICMPCRSIY